MAVSEYDKKYLSKEDQNKIQKATDYGASTGDWATAHAMAESIRASAGYSGGDDGSAYKTIATAPQMPVDYGRSSENDLSSILRQQKAAQTQAALAGLKSAYETNMRTMEDTAARLPQTFQDARNNLAEQDAIAKRNFDERAIASGLNTGAAGQATLARQNAYMAGLTGLDREEANVRSDIELEKANLQSQYEAAINEAKNTGDADLANALYQELVRVQNMEREDAANAQALALKYGLADPTGLSSISNLSDLANLGGSKGTSDLGGGTTQKSTYDNAGLSSNTVSKVQNMLSLDADGKWGHKTTKAMGMTAAEFETLVQGIQSSVPRAVLMQIGMNRGSQGQMSTIQSLQQSGAITEAQAMALMVHYGII